MRLFAITVYFTLVPTRMDSVEGSKYGSKHTRVVCGSRLTEMTFKGATTRVIPHKEVNLSNQAIISLVKGELQDRYKRLGRVMLKEVFDTFWYAIASELMLGNSVITPIGTFSLWVERRWENGGLTTVSKKFRPTVEKRVRVQFKENKFLKNSIKHIIERQDAQETKRDRDVARHRSLERIARYRQRVAHERVGRKTNVNSNQSIRRHNDLEHT